MTRPERGRPYQYAFDFGQKPLDPAGLVYEGGHRFVRTVHEHIVVRSPAEVAQHAMTHIFTPFAALEQEELWTLLLNTKQRITHEALIYRGTINMLSVRMAEVFRPAIRYNAAFLVLAHNHPSGDPTPSPEDIDMTKTTQVLAQTLGLDLLDHLVIGNNRWVSFKERGLGF